MSDVSTLEACLADHARRGGRGGVASMIASAVVHPVLGAVVFARLSRATARHSGPKRALHLFWRVMHRVQVERSKMELNWRTEIGPGLLIVGGRGLVINAQSTIGANVTLHGGVTLGRRDRRAAKDGARVPHYPSIGDDVRVGPNAVVLGARIGQGAVIGPLALVVDDVASGAVALAPASG